MPCIVLAGGLGTRLRGVINDLPKPMAMINGNPFLHYVFVYLARQKIKKVILSVGYRANVIESYFGDNYLDIEIVYSREDEPLGTGGGIKKAFELVDDFAFVLNGDTFFDVDLNALHKFHLQNVADISLALKPMKSFDRYGTVQLRENRIINFVEKKFLAEGLINGGVYFFGKNIFENIDQEKFSFEKEVLEKLVSQKKLCGKIYNDYFIDIGIPEDYAKAQQQMK
ncbi:MAG: nucleotidyltransferase family protein [Bacteroidetes bacterium]|nr:nucleotidyltransferase family protein [Bacteroidota bacterium]